MTSKSKLRIALAAVPLLLAACGDSGSPASPGPRAAAPSGARTIEIEAEDALRFDPSEVTVSVGETIYFVVSNPAVGHHEFILGDEDVQAAHQGEGGHGGHASDDALAALDLPSGATETATVTFDEPGTILFGCHVDGHYGAGMVGTITVEA